MNQFDSVNNLISRMEAYIINKQVKGTPKSRVQAKVMKKALSWVKESMENVTELTIPDEKPVVAIVQCRMYTPLEGTSFCKGMDSSNAAYEQCDGCPILGCNCYHIINGRSVCYGTKEIDECDCGGSKANCNHYKTSTGKAATVLNLQKSD